MKMGKARNLALLAAPLAAIVLVAPAPLAAQQRAAGPPTGKAVHVAPFRSARLGASPTTPATAPAAAQDSIHRAGNLTDAGDFYWADGRKVSLLRAADEAVVGLAEGTRPGPVVRKLTGAGGPLAGFTKAARLGRRAVLLKGPSSPNAASAAASIPGVSWAAPGFFEPQSAARVRIGDEIVVAFAPGVDASAFLAARYPGHRRLKGTHDQFVARLAAGGGVAALAEAARLHGAAGVAWASPNLFQDFRVSTNDPLYASQWHLNNTGQTGAAADADVDGPEAWTTTAGSGSIVIAVIDNGVQTAHPDLAANLFVNAGEIAGNGIDDDGNGWTDDVSGWDFVDDDNNANPARTCDNHGTAVAGVAAARGENSLGVTGACQTCAILPIKIAKDTACTGGGFASDADIAAAIYYSAGRTADGLGTWRGSDVLNNSWGGGAPNTTLTTAFNWASTSGRGGLGAPVLVASGNGASGYGAFTLTGFPAGEWIVEWRYSKNQNTSSGSDTVWLADVVLPDGSVERFDAPGLPAGWSSSGAVPWTVVDDPAHAYGTGRYEAKAGAITHNQTTTLRSRPFTVAVTSDLTFQAWVSSQTNFDKLNVYASSDGGESFSGPFFGSSGVPFTIAAADYPADLASTIAVGASTDWDYRSDYSQYGALLDVVAPSGGGNAGIATTDRTGTAGYNGAAGAAGDYTTTPASAFNGTSSATPLAAGVAGLILSRNPALPASQVRSILRDSADEIGGVTYTGGFNTYYGFGRVNAAAALAAVPPPSPCGDGNLDGGEQCDDGNTIPGDCCSATCQFESVGAACPDDGNVCTTDLCNSSGSCLHTAGNAGTVCRAQAGICDAAETCTGSSATCPSNQFAPSGTTCRTSVGACDAAEACSGSSASCPADMFASSVTPCRGSNGVCDVAENCTGSSNACPANTFAGTATVCRGSASVCDAAENCTGTSASCPADAFATTATVCRGSSGVCDAVERCTGTGTTCPSDLFAASTTVCRTSVSVCDVAESCSGTAATCPGDAFASSATSCRGLNGVCDVAENCTGTSNTCPANVFAGTTTTCRVSISVCDAAETCSGTAATCPADAFAPSSTPCRGSNGVCDVAENCTGTGNACPANTFAGTTTVCRGSASVCDAAETCTGTTASCPADAFAGTATVCRGSAGVCDVAENCTGTSNACPANMFASTTTACRVSISVCDAAETCSGTSVTCPADAFAASTTPCRGSAGVCDVAENCTGSGNACPANAFAGTATFCRASVGVCDAAERCSGTAASCPADAFASSTTPCRGSAGVCDVAETCSGTSNACPTNLFAGTTTVCRMSVSICDATETCSGTAATCSADAFAPSSTPCRGSSGVCDVAETCTGTSNACPANTFAGTTTVCRASAGVCDVAERCSGSAASCPADSLVAADTPCTDDGEPCTTDVCDGASAACQHQANSAACDDGEFCNGFDTCSGSTCSLHAGDPCAGPDGDADCVESCDESADSCTAADPDSAPCNDGSFCTLTDACSAGSCVGSGTPCPGADGDDNCAESCDEAANGCIAADPDESSCDDGLPCTTGDECSAGSCSGDPSGCISTTTTLPDATCGDTNDDGNITAGDALFTLRAAVGTATCPLAVCDWNGDGKITAPDALAILRYAVGQELEPQCPPATAAFSSTTIPTTTTLTDGL